MIQTGISSDFFTKINKIVNYFARTSRGGFLFCSCDKTAVLSEINKIIIERAKLMDLNINELYLSSEDAGQFLHKIRERAKRKPDGIIISNLDELIVLTRDQIIKDINFARDILLGLKVPLLFCVSKENISKFANQAQDLFLRRDRGVIHFSDVPGITKLDEFQAFKTMGSRDSVDFTSLNLKISLLENQLKEAEREKYKPGRIANEIALDLIQLYLDSALVLEANELFNRYKPYFKLENDIKAIKTIAELHTKNCAWEKAFDYYLKAKKILENVGDIRGLARVSSDIGFVHFHRGEMSEALRCYLKCKEINEEIGDTRNLAVSLDAIGSIYRKEGQLDKALENYFESKKISEQADDAAVLAVTLNNIGALYHEKGELDKSLEYYLKSKKISEKIGHGFTLAHTLVNIGFNYYCKEKWNEALDCYLKSKEIYEEIGDKTKLKDINEKIQMIKDHVKSA